MIRDIDINLELLIQYKLKDNTEAFWQLYDNIQYLLKKILRNPFFIYSHKIRDQRYSKFYNLEQCIGRKISINLLIEKYRVEFIQKHYLLVYSSEDKNNFSLDLCFADLLDKITVEQTENFMERMGKDCRLYLGIRFCDYYWCFIEKCLRRDFPKLKNESKPNNTRQISKIMSSCSSSQLLSLNKCTKSFSSSSFINSILIKETIDEFKKVLNHRDKNILDLIVKDYSYQEICEILKITNVNLRKRIFYIRRKIYPIYISNGCSLK